MLVQEGAVSVAAVLAALPGTTQVGVDDELWGGRLSEKARRKAVVINSSGIVAPTALLGTTHHVLGPHVLKSAQIGSAGHDPVAAVQRQVRAIGHPET